MKYECYLLLCNWCHGSFWSLLCCWLRCSSRYLSMEFYGDAHMFCVVLQQFVRMIDICNKYLLNQIMRASTSKTMKFYTCISTKFMCRTLSHSQSVWINVARVLIVTLSSEFLVWLLDIWLHANFHHLPRHDPIPSSTGIHGATVVLFQSRMHLSWFEINRMKSL